MRVATLILLALRLFFGSLSLRLGCGLVGGLEDTDFSVASKAAAAAALRGGHAAAAGRILPGYIIILMANKSE